MYDFPNIWDLLTSAYTNVMGVWFWFIFWSFITLAVYQKTQNITVAGAFLLVVSIIFYPLFSQSALGSLVFFIFVVIGLTASVYGLYLKRKEVI